MWHVGIGPWPYVSVSDEVDVLSQPQHLSACKHMYYYKTHRLDRVVGGGGTLPYLKVVGNFPRIDILFWHFQILLGPFVYVIRSYWHLLSAEKISLSLSHVIPEIIWTKVGLIVAQICHLTILKHIVPISFLISNLVDPFFFLLFLDHFDPSFLKP